MHRPARLYVTLALLVVNACGGHERPSTEGTGLPFDPAGSETGSKDEGGVGDDGPAPGLDSSDSGGAGSGGHDSSTSGGEDDGADTDDLPPLEPPAGESSKGSGGPSGAGIALETPQGEQYRIITPQGSGPYELLLVISGVEGAQTMTNNLVGLAGQTQTAHMLRAVVDGEVYFGDEMVGEHVLDDVRSRYDVDNDHTYLLSESAGTISGLSVGLVRRQSYFAAYWANDINAGTDPVKTAEEIGFAPYGGVGPGGELAGAEDLIAGMQAAGYRTPPPAPYDGPGAGVHGDPNQFIYALSWFDGKSRLD